MKKFIYLVFFTVFTACKSNVPNLELPTLFADHMVLQQNTKVNIWGWSNPNAKIAIKTQWGATAKAKANEYGKWLCQLQTPNYGGPYIINIINKSINIELSNVLIGEVWLCSGQSNMEMPLSGWPADPIDNSENEIAQANYPKIRMFTVGKSVSVNPADNCSGNWQLCTPENAVNFSAVAYYFGKILNTQLNIPIGLIHSSWGGTPAESWTPIIYLNDVPGFESFKSRMAEAKKDAATYREFLVQLKSLKISDLPEKNPFLKLDLNDEQFYDPELDDSTWKTMEIPGLWEYSELPNFDGMVWFRTSFILPEDIYPESFELYLGPIDDMDATFVNGIEIGRNETAGLWSLERKYSIPQSILKKGINTIAVKVTDNRGGGGIYGENGPAIMKGNKRIVNLAGKWKYLPLATIQNNEIFVFEKDPKSYDSFEGTKFTFTEHSPSLLYNGMIAPLVPYSMQGVIWYQGESNVGRAQQYKKLFPTMIKAWRDKWEQGVFPFYYVQIAPYNYGEDADNTVSELRQAQLETLALPNLGMVVTMDIGNPETIHPSNKKDVGERLALWALNKTYKNENIEFSGPIISNANFIDNKVIISFNYNQTDLELRDTNQSFFELAGSDSIFYQAHAKTKNGKLILQSKKVTNPTIARYAWGDYIRPNFFSKNGLPASPFLISKNN